MSTTGGGSRRPKSNWPILSLIMGVFLILGITIVARMNGWDTAVQRSLGPAQTSVNKTYLVAAVTSKTDSLSKVNAILAGSLDQTRKALTLANTRADSLAKVNATLAEKANKPMRVELDPKVVLALERIAAQNTKPAATPVVEHTYTPSTMAIVSLTKDRQRMNPPVTTVVTNAGYATTAPQATMTMKQVTVTPWVPAKASGTSQFGGKPDLLPDYDGDMYGEVNTKDPWDLQYDATTASWMLCIYINAPEEVAWMTDATPTGPYIYGLGCLRNVQQDPVGQLIGPSCVEFTFKSSGIVRVNLPIRVGSPTSVPVGWGWILPSSATVDGSNNGYKFDLTQPGNPKRVAIVQNQ